MKSSVEMLAMDYRALSTPELGRRFINAWIHKGFYPDATQTLMSIISSAMHERKDVDEKRAIYMSIRRSLFEIKDEDPGRAAILRDMMHYFVSEFL
jgi:hypothetical protein